MLHRRLFLACSANITEVSDLCAPLIILGSESLVKIRRILITLRGKKKPRKEICVRCYLNLMRCIDIFFFTICCYNCMYLQQSLARKMRASITWKLNLLLLLSWFVYIFVCWFLSPPFIQGFTNAVKRPVRIREFLLWLNHSLCKRQGDSWPK